MSTSVVTVAPGCTLHDAAKAMADRRVGAAVVIDPNKKLFPGHSSDPGKQPT